MKFIVDAQLPYGIKLFLLEKGFDTIHTDDFPSKELTTDKEIITKSLLENRIIITKDKDFLDRYILNNQPKKLVLITTGNIKNKEFYALFKKNINKIIDLLQTHSLIELNNLVILGQ